MSPEELFLCLYATTACNSWARIKKQDHTIMLAQAPNCLYKSRIPQHTSFLKSWERSSTASTDNKKIRQRTVPEIKTKASNYICSCPVMAEQQLTLQQTIENFACQNVGYKRSNYNLPVACPYLISTQNHPLCTITKH